MVGQITTVLADKNINITAISDPDPASIKFCRQKYNPDAKVYRDYHELVKDPGISWVMIGTPNNMHKDPAMAAFRAGKGRCVYPKAHPDRRFSHPDHRQGNGVFRVGQRFPNGDFLQSSNGHDVARLSRRDFHSFEPLVYVKVTGAFRKLLAMLREASDRLPCRNAAGKNPADGS